MIAPGDRAQDFDLKDGRRLPRITVITPSFNQAAFLEGTIRSVLDQEYPSLEYIIIDGGSTDNSVEIIRKYSHRLAYWCSEKDGGQSHAINKGLRIATGEIIGWLNSDDIYYADSIWKAAQIFAKNPATDILFGNYDYIDDEGRTVHRRRELPYDFRVYLWTGACYHANVAGFYRKKCFDSFGLVREDLHHSMDYELYLRFGINRCTFQHVPDVLGAYRLHMSSKTILARSSFIQEAKVIRQEHFTRLDTASVSKLLLPIYYKTVRYIKKLFTGCYSLGNLRSRAMFRKMREGTVQGH